AEAPTCRVPCLMSCPSVPCCSSRLRSYSPGSPSTSSYPLSLRDALPLLQEGFYFHAHVDDHDTYVVQQIVALRGEVDAGSDDLRSEEHTSELQSRENLVCRLLLEKKKSVRVKRRQGEWWRQCRRDGRQER